MTDNLTKEQRRKNMSNIRGKWTGLEVKAHNLLKVNKIVHKMHPKVTGNPDIILGNKVAVFIHGCFWHKCSKHFKAPKSNVDYWLPKITKNAIRDKKNLRLLRKKGYRVVVVWEHDLKGKSKDQLNNFCKKKFL
jgi:DNA mismatch endonuclease (patch repair protein)